MMDVTQHLNSALAALTDEVITTQRSPGFGTEPVIPGVQDHSPVPAGLIQRLERIANALGYQVNFTRGDIHGNPGTLGSTCTEPWNREILLRDDMTPATTVRVFCHELGHAFSAESGENLGFFEEYAAESVAALVTKTLGCTDGVFSKNYLTVHAGSFVTQAANRTGNFSRTVAKAILDAV